MALTSCRSVPRLHVSRAAPVPVAVTHKVALCVRAAASKPDKAASAPEESLVVGKMAITNQVAKEAGLTKDKASLAVDVLVSVIEEAVASGKRVTIIGFGSFEPRKRAARNGRNPATGAEIKIPETTVPAFKPAAAFKDMVKQPGAAKPKPAAAAAPAPAAKPKAASPARPSAPAPSAKKDPPKPAAKPAAKPVAKPPTKPSTNKK